MDEQERVRLLESTLDRQLHWIGAADAKVAINFAISTAMLGVLAAVSPNSAAQWTVAPGVFASLAAISNLASLLLLSFASFPRTTGPKGSLVYFGGISQQQLDRYREKISSLASESYVEDLAAQCHRNAEIANSKFTWVQRSSIALYLSVVPWGLALYLLYNAQPG